MGVGQGTEYGSELACAPTAETVAALAPLSENQRRDLLNASASTNLALLMAMAGIASLCLATGQLFSTTGETGLAVALLYGLPGIAMLAAWWRVRRQPPTLRWPFHIGGMLFLIITSMVTADYALRQHREILYLYILVQLGAATALHSRAWLIGVMAFGDLAWGVTSLAVGGVDWLRGLAYLVGTSAVSIGIHNVRRQTITRMEELRQAAERVSAAKTELLADMRHEIRTPVSGVLGLSGLLLDTRLEAKQAKMVWAIRESADALMGIIDDMLELAQLRRGEVELTCSTFDLEALLESVTALMQPRAESKGIELESEMKGFTSRWLVGDAGRIRQVVLNLVSNAIKFTDEGGVTITAESMPSSEKSRIRLSVQDTGAGIPESMLEQLFGRHGRVSEQTRGRDGGGSGLGLAISKELVELMGGRIDVQSAVGAGTLFWIEVDLERGPEDTLRVEDPEGIGDLWIRDGARVLLAQDNPTSRMVTEALLRKLSCEVDLAADGRIAIHKARENTYDIVFMDCQMSLMDGFQATARIRRSNGCKDLPVIALTPTLTTEERQRCLEAGMNDAIGKPIRASTLARALERWVPIQGRRGRQSVPSIPPLSALDMAMVRRLVSLDGEDHAFVRDVMGGYVDELAECVNRLAIAFERGDEEEVRRVAHSMKGASKQIGATRAGALLGSIESAADLGVVGKLLEELRDEVPRVRSAVRGLLLRSQGASCA